MWWVIGTVEVGLGRRAAVEQAKQRQVEQGPARKRLWVRRELGLDREWDGASENWV